ncbi:MAG: asparagine synthase (glutamine-hydrolyzing) [Clostridiales bacterium]|jgi:asparagine synthase (glutamine-hydrolysing)|nr:asparagine synthase (glutamine-hydrolyzing) [Clostridiales bacterium]
MCGIAGFLTKENNFQKEKILKNMINCITHRGPDQEGIFIKDNIFFGHKRLAIIDVQNGKQPMSTYDNKLIIIYNGEIYNSDDIKKDLLKQNLNLKTNCDTEIVLKSYLLWGNKCVNYLNGIFAFAILDLINKKIFLARDRFGVKPLFYHFDKNNFVFASEIKSILKFPNITTDIKKDDLRELFAIGPSRTHGNAIFKDISELKPGYILEFDLSNHKIKFKKYFELKHQEHKENIYETAEHVRILLTKAIKRQLVSDVPVGYFLSGGLDSSIISAVASQEYKNIDTFSLDFLDNKKYFSKSLLQPENDEYYAKYMANYLNSNHHEIILSPKELADNLEKSLVMRDLPGMADVDSSLLKFCGEIKNYVTVALSGECSDEIFGGYPWFYNKIYLDNKDNFPWISQNRNDLFNIKLDLENYSREKYLEEIKKIPENPDDDTQDKFIKKLTFLDINYFMANLLERKDRMSMANGLEVRVPYCDHELVNYVFNIPWRYKFYNQQEKSILKLAFKKIIPEKILSRKKNPYPKTFHEDYKNILVSLLDKKFKESSLFSEIINREKVFEFANKKLSYYGQLMSGTQVLAYFYQVALWFDIYKINIC